MAHLFVIANSIIIVCVTTFFIYALGAAFILGEWHQLLMTAILLAVLIALQLIMAIIAES